MAIQFESTLTYQSLLLAYQITMFAAWGVGVDLPRLLARYARSYPSVMNIHGISMMIISLITIMYVVAKTIMYYTDATQTASTLEGVPLAQFVFEWILVGFILIQIILGSRVRFEMTSPELSTDMFWLKKIHRYLGTFMSLIGKVMVSLFLFSLQSSSDNNSLVLFRGFLFFVVALIFIFIILEVVYRIQTRKIMCKFPLKNQSKFRRHLEQILENINNNVEDFDDYKELGLRYIILDNMMYYIDEKFIHPGGEHIFSLYNGQEINYLFRGTHNLVPDFPRHRHTKYAMNYLEEREVGKIEADSLLLNFSSQSQELVTWKIISLQKMETDTFLVQFESKDGYVKQTLKPENFGKYMMISCPSEQVIGKVQRPYSIIVSLGNYQAKILERFKESYKYYYHGSNSSSSIIKRSDVEVAMNNTTLTFCVKEYRDGLFTKFMLNSWAEKNFALMGPFGRGLRLKGKSKGFYIIIAAGTGVFPFIDLFHYLLQKTLIKLIAERAGEVTAKKLNEERIDYSELEGLKILFVGSFLSPRHFYLDTVIKDLYHMNRKHDLNQFDMILRYNNNETQPDVRMTKELFDSTFIKSLIDKEPDRIYYCGPPAIEHTIRKVQEESKMKGNFYYI